LVPRKGAPAIFALLCRVESYRALPALALACRYEFPGDWPRGVNLQPGDFAARELVKRRKIVINVGSEESTRHIANFRGTTGLRASREHITRAAGEQAFLNQSLRTRCTFSLFTTISCSAASTNLFITNRSRPILEAGSWAEV
jgi:hypothetical protein